jgi:hypothetical protein
MAVPPCGINLLCGGSGAATLFATISGDGVRHNRSSEQLELMTPGCFTAPGVFCFACCCGLELSCG